MDKAQAAQKIREVFESPFDEGRLHKFVKELLNDIDGSKAFEYHGSYIPEAYREHIKQYKRVGQYTDPNDKQLDILTINLKKETSLERARTMQRNFVLWYLKQKNRDDALVAYYTDGNNDWRFSYVRLEYQSKKDPEGIIRSKEEPKSARRYSFLVGKNEPSHTAQQQLVPLLQDAENNPTLARIEQAFNIESVTKEFYQKYKELYLNLKDNCIEKEIKRSKQFREELNSKGIDEVSFTKKLLGQIVFLYFIQKKGWLGVPKDKTWGNGDRRYLRTLLDKAIASKQNFYADYLEYLFYQALATEHRGGSDPSYYKKLDCKIPFLNGGLFEADYDWEKTDITIPNNFFTNKNKTKEGDEGDGILDVFDRYNFTVKEDEPLEKEVAVDPEMLGKVFENLLEVKDRKSKGAYYTPREIVHYMCQESLINYLDVTLNSDPASYIKIGDEQTDAFGNKAKRGQLDLEAKTGEVVKVPKSDIEEFIRHGIAALENDVRVESKGKETDRYSYQIPQSIRTHAQELDKALETIRICDPAIGSGAFPVGMMSEIIKARQVLDTYLKREHTVYDFKRHCIQECIYGVDIDHSAIDIAKLRLWLSLVVDEEDFYKIKPLPNLDYKIVEGNSLMELPENVFPDLKTESEIEKLKIKFFEETDNDEKKKLRKQINEKIRKLLDSAEEFTGYHVDFDFKLFFSEVFHEKKGFDVVIGNPPYIQLQKDSGKLAEMLKSTSFKTYERTGDVYAIFYEVGFNILTRAGVITFITSSQWQRTNYGRSLRRYFLKKDLLVLINLGPGIFNNAVIDTNILIAKNLEYMGNLKGTIINKEEELVILDEAEMQSMRYLTDDAWAILNHTKQTIKQKLQLKGKPLNQWNVKINFGIKTGYNEAFIIDEEKRKELVRADKKSVDIIKSILRGREIEKYYTEWDGGYLLNTHNGIKIKKVKRIDVEKYPTLKKYLMTFKRELVHRADQGDTPYNLRNCAYLEEFSKEKIIWKRIGSQLRFSYSNEEIYCLDSTCIATGEKIKYLTGLLNSKLCHYQLFETSPKTGMGDLIISVQALEPLLVHYPSEKEEKSIVTLVDKILETKKSNPLTDTTALESEVDVMVYQLYGLTDEEIAIVEGKN